MATFHDFTVRTLDGRDQALADFRGQVLLVVNTASECGFTPQYAGLDRLHQAYAGRGFAVLGFPCNQFGAQEPGAAGEIQAFCQRNYGVSFPLFEKVDVKGEQQAPVYGFLTKRLGVPTWNFHKYLVDKDGKVIAAFPSELEPESPELKGIVEGALS